MQIHQLQSSTKKTKRRVGRGGKRGRYSGRGLKGQKARAGRRIRPALRDILKKIHKRRGYHNQSVGRHSTAVSLNRIERVLNDGETITPKVLREKFGIRNTYSFKIVGNKVGKKFLVKGIRMSEGAAAAVTKAGGTVSD